MRNSDKFTALANLVLNSAIEHNLDSSDIQLALDMLDRTGFQHVPREKKRKLTVAMIILLQHALKGFDEITE